MKRCAAMVLALLILCSSCAMAEGWLSYDGEVIAGLTQPVTTLFGGSVKEINVRKGDLVSKGDLLATIATTCTYAPLEGTITGVYANEGDDTASIVKRYGGVLYIEPTNRYTIEASTEKAYNNSENKYIHLGEEVYLCCTADGTHKGTGIVATFTEKGYTVEVTGGDFYMGETVGIFRKSDYSAESRIGRGTVGRTVPVAVEAEGSLLKCHVKNGDFVERGELLFETVDGVLDGLYVPDCGIYAPEDGIIASVEATLGAKIEKGGTVVTLNPVSSLQIEFLVPEEELPELTISQKADIAFDWDSNEEMEYEGTITFISHLKEEKTEREGTYYRAVLEFNPDFRIRIGMRAAVYPGDAEEISDDEGEDAE